MVARAADVDHIRPRCDGPAATAVPVAEGALVQFDHDAPRFACVKPHRSKTLELWRAAAYAIRRPHIDLDHLFARALCSVAYGHGDARTTIQSARHLQVLDGEAGIAKSVTKRKARCNALFQKMAVADGRLG